MFIVESDNHTVRAEKTLKLLHIPSSCLKAESVTPLLLLAGFCLFGAEGRSVMNPSQPLQEAFSAALLPIESFC